MIDDADHVVIYADRVLPLSTAQLTDDYDYQSLPLCVIDAVYSIGVRYEGVRHVVARYCDYTRQQRVRSDRKVMPLPKEQENITTFCDRFARMGLAKMTDDVFGNRQRTSSRGGILKSEAVFRFASVLRNHRVEYLQDVTVAAENGSLEQDICSIPGQRSGISLQYFWMLAGSNELIKPDRMVLRFLEQAIGRQITVSEAQILLSTAAHRLASKHPHMTPRLLDYAVWQYQRTQPTDSKR